MNEEMKKVLSVSVDAFDALLDHIDDQIASGYVTAPSDIDELRLQIWKENLRDKLVNELNSAIEERFDLFFEFIDAQK